MSDTASKKMIEQAQRGIASYLDRARKAGRIDQQLYDAAKRGALPALQEWLTDPDVQKLSPHLREGICRSIRLKKWADLVNAFRQSVRFGTGGIRGLMAFDRPSIVCMKEKGIDAPILKGSPQVAVPYSIDKSPRLRPDEDVHLRMLFRQQRQRPVGIPEWRIIAASAEGTWRVGPEREEQHQWARTGCARLLQAPQI